MDNKERLIKFYKEKHQLYASVFGSDDGKKLLEELERDCYINRSTVSNPNAIDKDTMLWNEARRSIVLQIKNFSDKDFIQKMINCEKDAN